MDQKMMLQQIMKAPNKMGMLENIVKQNPQLSSIWELFKKGDNKGLESYAKELFKQNGRDFDKEFSQFMNNFK